MNDTRKRIPYLLDEQPITFYPSLAKALKNPNLAIILQQLHFLLNVAKQNNNQYVFVDNRWWVYNSYAEWQEKEFSWLSQSTIKGLFGMLEEKGIVLSRQGVHNSFDRKKWYTIDYDKFAEVVQSIGQILSDVHETDFGSSDEQDLSGDNKVSESSSSDSEQEDKRSRATHSKKSLPANRKTWQWEHIERYALENPDIDRLAAFDTPAVSPSLKQLPLKSVALDCIELFEELQRNGIGAECYNVLYLGTTLKPEYSTFKCMLWAVPKYLKKDIPPPMAKQTAREKMLHDLQTPTEIVLPLMRKQS